MLVTKYELSHVTPGAILAYHGRAAVILNVWPLALDGRHRWVAVEIDGRAVALCLSIAD